MCVETWIMFSDSITVWVVTHRFVERSVANHLAVVLVELEGPRNEAKSLRLGRFAGRVSATRGR